MKAILSAPGSRGDVNPMIAIGAQLRRAGFDVVISIAEPYAGVAESVGLRAEPILGTREFHELLSHDYFWKPIRGPRAVMKQIAAALLPRHRDVIHREHVAGETLLVSHPLDLASRVFRDANPDTPLVDVHLQPMVLRTVNAPPRLSPWWFECTGPPSAVRAFYWLVDRIALDPVIAGPVNRLRAEYGLKPIRRPMDRWWMSPDLVLAMYPDWYAPATKGFVPQLTHCGFPLSDVDGESFSPPQDHPVIFTAGTAHHHSRAFFQQAVEVCVELNHPGWLVSTHPENFPTSVPSLVKCVPYVSFSQLLPHCGAIVHHGGIGTTSQAFAAGIPQIIRPLAFDQFDNATRVERLGCGFWLRRRRELKTLVGKALAYRETDQGRRTLTEIAERVRHTNAAALAASRAAQQLTSQATLLRDT